MNYFVPVVASVANPYILNGLILFTDKVVFINYFEKHAFIQL